MAICNGTTHCNCEETECPKAPDGENGAHCRHWYDNGGCCWCGDGPCPVAARESEEETMREITHHIIPEANADRVVYVCDEPDPNAGGACHHYSFISRRDGRENALGVFKFQHGPIKEVGDNGPSDAQVLAVLIHRCESFQAGPFASPFNATTLHHLRAAMEAIHDRTRDRASRGVEGLSKK